MKAGKTLVWEKVLFILTVVFCLFPFCYVLYRSFYLTGAGISAKYYYEVFLGTSQYLLSFWKSLAVCGCIVAGQLVISTLAGYGFAKYDFKGKQVLFAFLMILMVLPLQVTLVPNYIMLDQMGLLNTYWALILPAIFCPLGTFILTQGFRSIPDEIFDAAKLDGCSTLKILTGIALPMNKSGLVCAMLLSFLDSWNMVEQPIAYLKDFSQYPISVALSYVPPADSGHLLVCCVLVLIPPMFLFLNFNQELVKGIVIVEVK